MSVPGTSEAAQWGIRRGVPAVVLAPMEGVTEAPMRALLTELGGFSFCVSEFVRVAHQPITTRTLLSLVPELSHGSRTAAGVPVQVQLLGGDPELVAESASRAIACGANGIDLNFGCPAPMVNRHDGGASLLRDPPRLRAIVRAVRSAVPAELPVSAKLRLGWDDVRTIQTTAAMAEEGGASWLTVHARTRMEGYAPPAHWELLAAVAADRSIPVVANGDIWSVDDYWRCREVSGCEQVMLGRGAVGDPLLALRIGTALAGSLGRSDPLHAQEFAWIAGILRFVALSQQLGHADLGVTRRVKQWLRLRHAMVDDGLFDLIKRARSWQEIVALLGDGGTGRPAGSGREPETGEPETGEPGLG